MTITLFQVSELSRGRGRKRAGRAPALGAQHQHTAANTASTAQLIFPKDSITPTDQITRTTSSTVPFQRHTACGNQHNLVVYIVSELA